MPENVRMTSASDSRRDVPQKISSSRKRNNCDRPPVHVFTARCSICYSDISTINSHKLGALCRFCQYSSLCPTCRKLFEGLPASIFKRYKKDEGLDSDLCNSCVVSKLRAMGKIAVENPTPPTVSKEYVGTSRRIALQPPNSLNRGISSNGSIDSQGSHTRSGAPSTAVPTCFQQERLEMCGRGRMFPNHPQKSHPLCTVRALPSIPEFDSGLYAAQAEGVETSANSRASENNPPMEEAQASCANNKVSWGGFLKRLTSNRGVVATALGTGFVAGLVVGICIRGKR